MDVNVLMMADVPRGPETERSPSPRATESEASLLTDPASDSTAQPTVINVAASPEETSDLSFEPIEVGERIYVGIAYDLNYFGEGLGMLPKVDAPTASRPSPVRPGELVELAIARHGASAGRLIGRLARELNAVAAREIAERNFLAMEAAPQLYFARPEEIGSVEAAEPRSAASEDALASAFEAMERSSALYFAESVSIEAPAPALSDVVELPSIPENPFAPADLVASIAEATVDDQPTELVAEAIALKDDPAPVRRGSVTRAVRLTGEAMAAWVNVFAEPALASVSPSTKIR